MPVQNQEVDEDVVGRMGMQPSTLVRPACVETERLPLEPVRDSLALVEGERIRRRDGHPSPPEAHEGISVEKLIDFAGITDHRLEAAGCQRL